MNRFRQRWQALNERYAALSRRERGLIAAAAICVPLLVGQALVVDPVAKRIKVAQGSIAGQSGSLSELQAQATVLQQQARVDPDAAAKAELAALQTERAGLDGDLKHFGETLVRPEEMNGLLESLLARHSGLRLLSLKTLAPQSLLAGEDDGKAGEEKAAARKFDLYRHGVEIRLEGSYGELLAYLTQLEQMQQRLFWGRLSYKVVDYPRAEMSLTVYTLSPDRNWLTL